MLHSFRSRVGAVVALVLLGLLAACGDNTATPAGSASSTTAPAATTAAMSATTASMSATTTANTPPAASGGNLTYTDSTKTTVTLTKTPTRFACITSICEDILAELGLQPVAVSDKFGAEPEMFGAKAASFGTIGGTFTAPSLEDIAKAQPDLVIGLAGVHDKLRDALKTIAPLYIMDLSSYNDSIKYLLSIGQLTGKSTEAQAAADKFMHKLNAYKAKSPKTKSAALISGTPTNFAADTDGALYGGMFAQVTKWPFPAPAQQQTGQEQDNTIPYSLEQFVTVNPDFIFVDNGRNALQLTNGLSQNPLWSTLTAVKSNQIVNVRQTIWETGRGTRSLGIALDEGMTKMYPDVFPTPLQ